VSPETQARTLDESRRRCPVCFCLHGDFDRKKGQIAHIDKDPSNDAPENLVFLCFDHHDEYDSTTRQSKNLTKEELVTYWDKLLLEVEARWANGTLDKPVPGASPPLVVNVSNVGGPGGSSVYGGGGGGGGAGNAAGGAGGEGSKR
jgi:hypothetical protein